jgi:hypothetical protein
VRRRATLCGIRDRQSFSERHQIHERPTQFIDLPLVALVLSLRRKCRISSAPAHSERRNSRRPWTSQSRDSRQPRRECVPDHVESRFLTATTGPELGNRTDISRLGADVIGACEPFILGSDNTASRFSGLLQILGGCTVDPAVIPRSASNYAPLASVRVLGGRRCRNFRPAWAARWSAMAPRVEPSNMGVVGAAGPIRVSVTPAGWRIESKSTAPRRPAGRHG